MRFFYIEFNTDHWCGKIAVKLFKFSFKKNVSLALNESRHFSCFLFISVVAGEGGVEAFDGSVEHVEGVANILAIVERSKKVRWITGASKIGA